eukprot:1188848-Rhodomonas_salina.1
MAHGHTDIAERLIDRSDAKTLDLVDEEGRTAMTLAVLHNQLGIIERLVAKKASVDKASREGKVLT